MSVNSFALIVHCVEIAVREVKHFFLKRKCLKRVTDLKGWEAERGSITYSVTMNLCSDILNYYYRLSMVAYNF